MPVAGVCKEHQHGVQQPCSDPVCGMQVDPDSAAGSFVYDGTTYLFCSHHCLNSFRTDPTRYLLQRAAIPARHSAADRGAPTGIDATAYTCPMHPDVSQSGPGVCPICGMALEPRLLADTHEANPELADMSRRLWLSLPPTVAVFVLAMAEMLSDFPALSNSKR